MFGGASMADIEEVTFTVNTQQVATRAAELAGKGNEADKLYYGVYEATAWDTEGKATSWSLIPALSALTPDYKAANQITVGAVPADISSNNVEVKIKLAKRKEYSVIFWAQSEYPMCTVNWAARTMSLSSTVSNAEGSDVFWSYEKSVKVDGAISRIVNLYRPFAQLNIGASNQDIADAKAGEMTVETSQVVVEQMPTTMNLETGAVSDEQNVTFTYANIPSAETYKFPVDGYQYLALNYVLVGATDNTVYDITLSYKDTDNNEYTCNEFTAVPLRRNYRTNIYGNLLSNSADFDVTIKPEPGTPDENIEIVEVGTAADLQSTINAMEEGEELTIVLTDDIDLSDLFGPSNAPARTRAAGDNPSVTLAKGKSLILDLNGKTITATDKSTTSSYAMINNIGNLTINDATGEGAIKLTAENDRDWNAYSSVISNQPGGKLTVNGGTIEHLGGTDMAYAIDNLTNGKGTYAETIINGGVIKSTYRPIRMFLNGVEAQNILTVNAGTIESTGGNKAAIWMQDPSANANTGTLYVGADAEIKNGIYLSVTEGSTEWPVTVSIASAALKNEEHKVITGYLPVGYSVKEEEGIWTVDVKYVAKVGEVGYTTLKKAVDAVEDGGTITLVADETFTENNRYDNGGWWDGLGYNGDKSFTIDLGGYTISQDGSLNDYLMWFKNDGAKDNTITLKNGTLDAGTTAYSAFATASSNAKKITINLEDINLINNISNGAVVKARGGSELNVKAGTIITALDSYTGIEAVGNNTVVNIFDGAEIYQKGKSSDVGAIVGASYNATMNIYGGYGQSAKCGIIVMSTGATINVSGGEWIANNDGTVAGGNQGVLVSQNNRNESGWACKSVMNVTGGTFKGGYDCWGMGPGVEADDAQINIKGGNFNADPTNYVVAGYEVTGNYTVGKPQALVALETAIANGGNVTLTNDFTLLESLKIENIVVLDLNGKTITAPLFSAFEVKAGGDLTLKNGQVVAYESTVRAIGGKAVIESGEYTSTGTAVGSTPATYRYSLDCREGGELIINGGTFKSNNGMINVGSTVTINGGKFENIVEKTMTRHFAYVSAPLIINDGEFYGKANSSAGGCFFCGAAAGADIQVNGGKFTSLWTSGSVNKIFESYYGGAITVTGGMFNTNGGIAEFVTENTDEATKAAYPYVAK